MESVSHRSLISRWHVTMLFMTRDMSDDDTCAIPDILRDDTCAIPDILHEREWPASHMRYLSLAYTRRCSMINCWHIGSVIELFVNFLVYYVIKKTMP
jgi:hypothetical protein